MIVAELLKNVTLQDIQIVSDMGYYVRVDGDAGCVFVSENPLD